MAKQRTHEDTERLLYSLAVKVRDAFAHALRAAVARLRSRYPDQWPQSEHDFHRSWAEWEGAYEVIFRLLTERFTAMALRQSRRWGEDAVADMWTDLAMLACTHPLRFGSIWQGALARKGEGRPVFVYLYYRVRCKIKDLEKKRQDKPLSTAGEPEPVEPPDNETREADAFASDLARFHAFGQLQETRTMSIGYEALRDLMNGLSREEIARKYDVTWHTLKTYSSKFRDAFRRHMGRG